MGEKYGFGGLTHVYIQGKAQLVKSGMERIFDLFVPLNYKAKRLKKDKLGIRDYPCLATISMSLLAAAGTLLMAKTSSTSVLLLPSLSYLGCGTEWVIGRGW